MNSYRLGLSIFLAIFLLDQLPLWAQEEAFQGTVWILKRPNFAYVNGRCIVKGTFEDRRRPLYQQGNTLRGGTGQNVSQMTIQGSAIQGEGFLVSDSSQPLGDERRDPRREVGTITDEFNGSLTSDGKFQGTVKTTYYRAGNQICSLAGSFTLTRVSGSSTPPDESECT